MPLQQGMRHVGLYCISTPRHKLKDMPNDAVVQAWRLPAAWLRDDAPSHAAGAAYAASLREQF